jgi:hypothetical protein
MSEAIAVKNPSNYSAALLGRDYEAPKLIVHGSVADLTGAALPGASADHSLPAGLVGLNATISL